VYKAYTRVDTADSLSVQLDTLMGETYEITSSMKNLSYIDKIGMLQERLSIIRNNIKAGEASPSESVVILNETLAMLREEQGKAVDNVDFQKAIKIAGWNHLQAILKIDSEIIKNMTPEQGQSFDDALGTPGTFEGIGEHLKAVTTNKESKNGSNMKKATFKILSRISGWMTVVFVILGFLLVLMGIIGTLISEPNLAYGLKAVMESFNPYYGIGDFLIRIAFFLPAIGTNKLHEYFTVKAGSNEDQKPI